jgi:branched-chain amino acid transport system substrate-binding protein
LGYDAYLILIQALERVGSADSVKLRDELAKTKDFQGAAGVVNFDENRDAVKSAVIKEVKNGKFTFKEVIEPTK